MSKEKRKDLKIDKRILKNSAAKNPDTAKPSTKLSASKIIIAFITNKNKPKVTIVAGNVKNTKSGLTNIFSKAITIATIIAEPYPETETPGKILDSNITANAVNRIFKNVFIMVVFSY